VVFVYRHIFPSGEEIAASLALLAMTNAGHEEVAASLALLAMTNASCEEIAASLALLAMTNLVYFGTFSQSFMNFCIPMSVSGCRQRASMTFNGMVATCAPIIAASTTCSGFLTEATMTSDSKA